MAFFRSDELVDRYYDNHDPETLPLTDYSIARGGPSWLVPLLRGDFFNTCSQHPGTRKNERNQFCIECASGSLCAVCVQKGHAGHINLQIRRSSYKEAVRLADVQRLLDLAGIQIYTINSAKIVFLNQRPQSNLAKGANYRCEHCKRQLNDKCRFCSLECKLRITRKDSTITLLPHSSTGLPAALRMPPPPPPDWEPAPLCNWPTAPPPDWPAAPPPDWQAPPSAMAAYDEDDDDEEIPAMGDYDSEDFDEDMIGGAINGLLPDVAMATEHPSPVTARTSARSSDETDDESEESGSDQ